jgi:hypothetical protein
MVERLIVLPINQLCLGENEKKYNFRIPTYQRGYRWTEQVEKLLSDLFEFFQSKKSNDDKYCLQPVIIKHWNDHDTGESICYEVIDGQQRLTTILILLNLFKEEKVYDLTYERGSENKADVHFREEAKKAAQEWLEIKTESFKEINVRRKLADILTSETQLIWYELSENTLPDDCRKLFRNINAGKIPLSVSELTKAMLLNNKLYDNGKSEQSYKAHIWDDMAHTLEEKKFWEFISDFDINSVPQTRLDYLLYFICQEAGKKAERDNDVFRYFEERLIGQTEQVRTEVETVFTDLRDRFRSFQDWFSNVEFCNYIGYLVRYSKGGMKKLIAIMQEYHNSSHPDFLNKLVAEIRQTLKNIVLTELDYGNDDDFIKRVLLVFAILTANKLDERFDFEPSGGWSLEHVFAQNSKSFLKDNEEKKQWLQRYLNSQIIDAAIRDTDDKQRVMDLQNLKDEIKNFVSGSKIEFEGLFNRIGDLVEHYQIDNIHNIRNLALLGKDDNASLQNEPFYDKRAKIINMMRSGAHHIPQSTLNLFQKIYSISFDNNGTRSVYRGNLDIWSKQDGDSYLAHLENVLSHFLPKESVNVG